MNKDVQRLTRFRIVNYKRALCGLIFLTFVHTEFFRPSSNIWIRLFQIELDHLRSLDLMIVRMTRSFKLNCTIFLNLTVRLNCRILGSYDSHIQACDRIIQKIGFPDLEIVPTKFFDHFWNDRMLYFWKDRTFWTCQKL